MGLASAWATTFLGALSRLYWKHLLGQGDPTNWWSTENMGIRFRCPSCQQRLNIKRVNAGKKGVCPHCRKSLVVPADSPPPKSASSNTPVSQSRSISSEQPLSDRVPPHSDPRQPNVSELERPHAEQNPPREFQDGKSDVSTPENYIDPIYEAPHRVWHIRDAAQQETGPFNARTMRNKIDRGQVMANDQVCREDWQDWVPASEAFPELGSPQSQIPIASDSVFTNSNYAISGGLTPKARRAMKQRQQKVLGIWLCVIGLLIVAALCYLLIRLI